MCLGFFVVVVVDFCFVWWFYFCLLGILSLFGSTRLVGSELLVNMYAGIKSDFE